MGGRDLYKSQILKVTAEAYWERLQESGWPAEIPQEERLLRNSLEHCLGGSRAHDLSFCFHNKRRGQTCHTRPLLVDGLYQ
jgi:hypothetical protein